MKNKLTSLSLLAASGSLHAAVISLNFQGGNPTPPNPSAMGLGETAGVVSVANWNNLAGGSQATAQTLVNDSGDGSGATVTWVSNGTWDTNTSDTPGNNRMMLGYLDTGNATTTNVTLADIPTAFQTSGYNVYVYYDGENAGPDRVGEYTIGSTVLYGRDDSGTNFSGTFTQGQSTDAAGASGNYMIFSGLTGAGFVLSATPESSTDGALRAPVNAIQIVQVPEPSGIALFAFGAGALAFRRRRSA